MDGLYKKGKLSNKQNISPFLRAHVISFRGYAAADRAAHGGSAGGLLVGAV